MNSKDTSLEDQFEKRAAAPTGASVASDWLALLAEDIDDIALSRRHATLVENAPDAATKALADEAARNAATISRRLAERRVQAREMAALNSLARRLASLRDPRELLQEVAAQSRQLIGVDVAYIMVVTADNDLRIDIVDGSMGSALRGLVLREGEGIGGEVIRTGQPLWSETYLDDERLRRIRSVDAAAVSEQLGGILGVPLQIGDERLGVLCTADRRPRRFTDHDVELLAHLAAHAAVALRNARLFEELSDTNAALVRTNAARQRANDLREMLTVEVIRGGGLSEVADAISRAVGSEVVVSDADGRRLDKPTLPGPLTANDVAGLLRETSAQATARTIIGSATRLLRRTVGEVHLSLTPVVLSDGFAGAVGVVTAEPVDEDTTRLLQIGATSIALVMAHERTLAEAELRTRGEFANALLSTDADETSLRRRANVAGIDLDAVAAVAVFNPGERDFRPASQDASRLAASLGGWAAEHAGRALVLLPGVSAGEVKTHLSQVPAPERHAAIGIAACSGGIAGVRSAHASARQASSLLLALGHDHAVSVDEELGVYRSLFSHAGRDDVAAFIRATIGALLDYDAQYQRDLTETLAVYLGSAQHHVRASTQLHIHANTLYQRLARIDGLLGDGWREPDAALQIQLALQLRSLAATLSSTAT